MSRRSDTLVVLAGCLALSGAARAADRPPTPEQVAFFEKKIRPALADHCYQCHSAQAEKVKGGLMLDTAEGLRKGGNSGPVLVPGNPQQSLLIRALRHQDDSLRMPPKQKLPDEIVADFETWVRMGAPDPRAGAAKAARQEIDIEKGRQFWSFQPPKKVRPPAVKDAGWPRTDIDRFLLAALEAKDLKPVDDADKRTLLRRAYLDLIGLPPAPEEVEAFVRDPSPGAFERVVDQLLASPHFGERWGRHWLDVARFGETSGKQVNFNYPHAWRYRDYVIAAFNADKPYDRFVREQIAGDLLPADSARQRAEQQIATGFLAIGPKPHVERNRLQFQMDLVDEQIDAMSQAFLGLTVACARCHDHKFDPIPQRDYYALAGIFRSTETCYGTIRIVQNNNPSPLIALPADAGQPAGLERLAADERARMTGQLDELRRQRAQLQQEGKLALTMQGILLGIRQAMLQSQLTAYDDDGTPKQYAMGVRERFRAIDSPLYQRGEVDKPGDVVPRGLVQVVSARPPRIEHGSGRLELAQWLASGDNPLTARVLVNRVWLHLFGRGLVPTPDNFGFAGQPPSHPVLLDYLAVSFRENGWSVKTLIRQIVLSRAYQLSSRFDARHYDLDPDNVLVWRMSKRRLDAETLRDAMLAVSGQLDPTPPRVSPVAQAGEGFSNRLMQPGLFDTRFRQRSVYLPVVRNYFLEALALFDFPDPNTAAAERATTTVPAQGLYLLNSPFVIRQAEAAADRLLDGTATDRPWIEKAYHRFFCRAPTAAELRASEAFLAAYSKALGKDGASDASRRRATATAFCQALFASAEFLYQN